MSIYIEDKNGKRRKFAGVGSEKDYIDDGIASEKMTWSSEKILDTLCPAFTVEGNPVTCQPVEGYPLGVKVSFAPRQEGEGDPSPENIRPISGWDSLSVTRCGKNLFDATKAIYNPAFWSYDSASNEWRTENSQTTFFYVDLPLGRGSYVLSAQVTALDGDTAKLAIRTTENVIVAQKFFRDVGLISLQWTCENEGTYRITLGGNTTGKVYIKNTMFELGSTPTAYEPYQGDTYDIALPETIYGGTVDAVTGVGSKTWGYIASYNGESLPGEWISDRDVYAPGTTPTTGAQVAYKLATPEPFQASGNRPLSSLPGTNTLYTDGNSLTVSGSTSPISAIESFKADVQASANQAEAVANILLGGA